MTNWIDALRNIARGGVPYRQARHRIFTAIGQPRTQSNGLALNGYLRSRLLKIKDDNWLALAFDQRDWKSLGRISASRTQAYDAFYIDLCLSYIEENRDRVEKLHDVSVKLTASVLVDDAGNLANVLDDLSFVDRQSLFAFRAISAQHSYSSEVLTNFLTKQFRTDWLRKRLLYPLVFHAITAPAEDRLDSTLSYVVTGNEEPVEREVIRFLLRDDLIEKRSLGFKSYIALLCHPYDAYDMLLNHIETQIYLEAEDIDEAAKLLARLARIFPTERTSSLSKIYDARSVETETDGAAILGGDDITRRSLPDLATALIDRVADLQPDWSFADSDSLPKPLAVLARMRSAKYPQSDDFDYLTSLARNWWFIEAGRLLNGLVTAMYLVPRRSCLNEARDIGRLLPFYGSIVPFLAASPSFDELLSALVRMGWPDKIRAAVTAQADAEIRSPSHYSDRFWIKALHWELRTPARRMQIGAWLAMVRREVRLRPAYLSGIDWRWIEKLIVDSRLRPFIGNAAGIYVLLLLMVEERERRSEALRVAAEPLIEGKSLREFVEWLMEEFGAEAVGFARYLLNPEDLLLWDLAPNMTAALAGRITALTMCVRRFGFGEILPESLFEQEWNTLTSSLLLMSVNAGQFEIPWTMFTKEAAERQIDLYTAAHSLEPTDEGSVLSETKVTTPYRFRNGKTVTYSYQARYHPTVNLVLAVVEDFLQHPSFGLEVLLSTRFRHDTMRREFAAVFTKLADQDMASVFRQEQSSIISKIQPELLQVVDEWLAEYMNSSRPDKPNGMFDIIPSADDMLEIVQGVRPAEGVEKVIASLTAWLESRLESQLPAARQKFEVDMTARLGNKLDAIRLVVLESQEFRASDVDIVIATARSALLQRVVELTSWFAGYSGERPPLSMLELKMAADGLFEADSIARSYKTYFSTLGSEDKVVQPQRARLCFDILREVFASALRHSRPLAARVRITPWSDGRLEGFRFSNLRPINKEVASYRVDGDPYTSLNDVIFDEGSSGLHKLASLSATILGERTSISVSKRCGSFHVTIPFWLSGCEEPA